MAVATQGKKVPFEKAISMTGYGLFHISLLWITGLCLMCVIIETMCMMFIIPAAQCDLNLSLSVKGLLSSVSFIGVVVSSYMWGYIADTKGRKNVLMVSLTGSGITTVICSIVPWSWLLIILRLINGFFIGGASCIVYAYNGEFHDVHYRPKVISWMSTYVAMGNMFLPGLAWLILPQDWQFDISFLSIVFKPWRLLLIIYTLPCLICALALCFFPESPKYLLTQGRKDEALEILKKIYSVNKRKNIDSFGVEEIIWEELSDIHINKNDGILKTMRKQTIPLFKGDLLSKTLMMCFLQFGVFASNAGIFMWYPEILNRMSHYVTDTGLNDVSLCSAIEYNSVGNNVTNEEGLQLPSSQCNDTVNTQVFLVSIIMGVAYACMYIFIGIGINIIGKKQLMVGFVFVTSVAGLASQFVSGYTLIQILVGVFIMGGTGIGIVNAIAVDLFPTQVRGTALAVSLMFGRIGAMVGTNAVGPLIYNLCDYLFYFVAVDHLLLIIVVLLLPTSQKLPKLLSS